MAQLVSSALISKQQKPLSKRKDSDFNLRHYLGRSITALSFICLFIFFIYFVFVDVSQVLLLLPLF